MRKITNAERIRRFTDCELAEFECVNSRCMKCYYIHHCDGVINDCKAGIARWMESTDPMEAIIPESAKFAESLN